MAARRRTAAPKAKVLRLSGSPASLRGATAPRAVLENPMPARASLVDMTSASGQKIAARSTSVAGGKVRVRLDPATPPGRYTGGIDVGGDVQAIEIDVIETVALQIRPASVVVDLAAGREHRATIAIENRGNVALTIDLAGDYPLGEELPLLREDAGGGKGDGVQRLADLFARAGGGRAGRTLLEVGRVTLSMPDGAFQLEPGVTRVMSIDLSWPEGLSATKRYRAFIPVFNDDLELVAVTGAKQT